MTTLTDHEVIERVRELLEEATRGPWSISAGGVLLDMSPKYESEWPAKVMVVSEDDCPDHPIADASCNPTCRESVEQEANARLIAVSRNALPALLDVLEASDALLRSGVTADARVLHELAYANQMALALLRQEVGGE